MAGVKGLKIEISPLVLLLLAVALGLGEWQMALGYVISVSAHEPMHFFMAKRLGYRCEKLKLSLTGAVLYGDFDALPPKDEILISLSAPLLNLFIALFFVALWWVFPESYLYTDGIMKANLAFGVVNLLPFYPMDGGRAMVALLCNFYEHKKCLRLACLLGFVGAGVFALLFIMGMVADKPNFSLAFFALYALSSALNVKKEGVYTKLLYSEVVAWRLNRGEKVRILAVKDKITIFEAHKKCNRTHLYVLEVYGAMPPYKYMGRVSVMQLEEGLMKFPSDTPIGILVKKGDCNLYKNGCK